MWKWKIRAKELKLKEEMREESARRMNRIQAGRKMERNGNRLAREGREGESERQTVG